MVFYSVVVGVIWPANFAFALQGPSLVRVNYSAAEKKPDFELFGVLGSSNP